MITLVENSISTEEYLKLRAAVQWRELSENQAIQVINNSLFFVKAVDDCGNVVGMGRIVVDGAVVCYIQALIVLPDMQGKNIGSLLIKRLIAFVNELREENTTLMLCLMCAKGREKFYEKHGFIARPNDMLGPGMIQYLQD